MSLKSDKSINKFEKHDLIFKLIILNAKYSFSFIDFANSNVIIYVAYINFDKSACFNEML